MRKREYMVILIVSNDSVQDCVDISVYMSIDEAVKGVINNFNEYKNSYKNNIDFNSSIVVLSGRKFSGSRNMIPLNVFLSSILIQDKEVMERLIEMGFKRTKKVVKI